MIVGTSETSSHTVTILVFRMLLLTCIFLNTICQTQFTSSKSSLTSYALVVNKPFAGSIISCHSFDLQILYETCGSFVDIQSSIYRTTSGYIAAIFFVIRRAKIQIMTMHLQNTQIVWLRVIFKYMYMLRSDY